MSRQDRKFTDGFSNADPRRARARNAFLVKKGILTEDGDYESRCDHCYQAFSSPKEEIAHDSVCIYAQHIENIRNGTIPVDLDFLKSLSERLKKD